MMRRLRKRWPNTFPIVVMLVIVGTVLGLGALWRPAVWILAGCTIASIIVTTVRQDRRARRRK